MRTWPEKPKKMIQLRVTGEENRTEYDKLMTIYRVAENADAIKSLVVHIFYSTGIWGLTHDKWETFCAQVLHTSRSQADRLNGEGAKARKFLSGDPFLKAIITQIKSKNTEELEVLYHGGTKLGVGELASLPPVSSRHAAIARDRKLLRAMKGTPENKWVEIADEATRNGPPTVESVKAAVAKIAPKADKTKPQAKPKSEPRIAPYLNALQDAVDHFQGILKASFAEQLNSTTGVGLYTRRITTEAKKVR